MMKTETKYILIHIAVMLSSATLFNIAFGFSSDLGFLLLNFFMIGLPIYSALYGSFSTKSPDLKSLFLKQAIFFCINFISILLCFLIWANSIQPMGTAVPSFWDLLCTNSLSSFLCSLVMQLFCFVSAMICRRKIQHKEKDPPQENTENNPIIKLFIINLICVPLFWISANFVMFIGFNFGTLISAPIIIIGFYAYIISFGVHSVKKTDSVIKPLLIYCFAFVAILIFFIMCGYKFSALELIKILAIFIVAAFLPFLVTAIITKKRLAANAQRPDNAVPQKNLSAERKLLCADIFAHIILIPLFVSVFFAPSDTGYGSTVLGIILVLIYFVYSIIYSIINGAVSQNIFSVFYLRIGMILFYNFHFGSHATFYYSFLHVLMLLCASGVQKLRKKEGLGQCNHILKEYVINIPIAVLGYVIFLHSKSYYVCTVFTLISGIIYGLRVYSRTKDLRFTAVSSLLTLHFSSVVMILCAFISGYIKNRTAKDACEVQNK